MPLLRMEALSLTIMGSSPLTGEWTSNQMRTATKQELALFIWSRHLDI